MPQSSIKDWQFLRVHNFHWDWLISELWTYQNLFFSYSHISVSPSLFTLSLLLFFLSFPFYSSSSQSWARVGKMVSHISYCPWGQFCLLWRRSTMFGNMFVVTAGQRGTNCTPWKRVLVRDQWLLNMESCTGHSYLKKKKVHPWMLVVKLILFFEEQRVVIPKKLKCVFLCLRYTVFILVSL